MAGRVNRRRAELPAADDIFRPTDAGRSPQTGEPPVRAVPDKEPSASSSKTRRTSGRVRHDEKMTVYITSAELLEIERARLALRSEHGLAVDRGRLVREAVSLVIADLEATGDDSALVRRLTGSD